MPLPFPLFDLTRKAIFTAEPIFVARPPRFERRSATNREVERRLRFPRLGPERTPDLRRRAYFRAGRTDDAAAFARFFDARPRTDHAPTLDTRRRPPDFSTLDRVPTTRCLSTPVAVRPIFRRSTAYRPRADSRLPSPSARFFDARPRTDHALPRAADGDRPPRLPYPVLLENRFFAAVPFFGARPARFERGGRDEPGGRA